MRLLDVNVLVYAFRQDSTDHRRYRRWVDAMLDAEEPFGIADLVLSGFVRIVTHPRVFDPPSPPEVALKFAEGIREASNCLVISPGERHWGIFLKLCRQTGARGNAVPDAFLAALAIESGTEWMTTDRAFARFPGLRWKHPLDDAS